MNNPDRIWANGDGPVEAALAVYFHRLDRGESVDVAEIIAAHPGCEAGLREFLSRERNLHVAVAAATPPGVPYVELAGRVLGDFRLVRVIGRGGMGVVWEALQLSLGRRVAVKLLPAAMCADPRHRTRFQNEARILAQLEHPNIVSVIAVGEDSEAYYFAMRYVEGITAEELIRAWPDRAERAGAETPIAACHSDTHVDDPREQASAPAIAPRLNWVAASAHGRERYRMSARIAAEVADALAHAHACGVLHRDVKPSNILLDEAGVARLSDFGLARMYGNATLTATGAVLGTLRYASPEQLRGTAALDERSDVYSLGVTLWELVTGQRLFATEDRNSVVSQVLHIEPPRPSLYAIGVPRDLETVIGRAVAKEPADRYPSAQAFGDDLRRLLAGQPVHAKPLSLSERGFRWANRNRVFAASAVAALLVVAAAALLASGLVWRANSRTAAALRSSRINEEKARRNAAAAEASAREARDLLYTADMSMAGAAWHKNKPAQVRVILDRYAKPTMSADGTAAEDPRGFEWYFLDRQIRPESDVLFQNSDALYSIQFMPDGDEFITAGRDSIVRLHDVTTGKALRQLDTQQGEINGVSSNPAGTLLTTAGEDGTVKVWNAADLTLAQSITVYNAKCAYAKFLNDELIVTGGENASHRLLKARSGELVRDLVSPDACAPGVASPNSWDAYVSAAGNRFWSLAADGNDRYEGVYEWHIDTGHSRRICNDLWTSRVIADRSERYLFVNMLGGTLRILNAKDGAELWATRLNSQLEALTLSPDERQLAVGGREGQVYLWDLNLGDPQSIVKPKSARTFSIHKSEVYDIRYSPDGNFLLTASRDGTVRRTSRNAPKEPFYEHVGLRKHQCFPLPDNNRILVFDNAPLSIREPATGKVIKRLSPIHYPVAHVSRDGTMVAAMSSEDLGIWSVETGRRILNHGQRVKSAEMLHFSPDDAWLAATTSNEEGREIQIINVKERKLHSSPISEYVKWALLGADDGLIAYLHDARAQIVCWNLRDGTERWKTKPFQGRYTLATISPDGRTLLAGNGRLLTLFDCATGAIRYTVPFDYFVRTFAFTKDGKTIAVGGSDAQLSLWHAATGQRLFDVGKVGPIAANLCPIGDHFLVRTTREIEGQARSVWLEF